jgi:hypothetical protein
VGMEVEVKMQIAEELFSGAPKQVLIFLREF